MTNDEILQAAKEAGCNVSEVESGWVTYRDEPVGNMLERFAAIIEKRTIERCADVVYRKAALLVGPIDQAYLHECAAAIRKLGEQE